VLGCLIRLREPDYGYALLEALNGIGITVDANTLYPLLRRLEKQGLLTSEWNTDEARPRKFYRTSPAGEQLAGVLTADWKNIDRALTRLTSGDER
jgi:PadR family transcriptional regulator PadR